jgi:CPA2 family monovalent cation:H+ antiporter-2
MATKVLTGYLAAGRAGIAAAGRWRAGLALMPRGEFSIVIAGLAVTAGIEPRLASLATAYVLLTVVTGPLLARLPDTAWFKSRLRHRAAQLAGHTPEAAARAATNLSPNDSADESPVTE